MPDDHTVTNPANLRPIRPARQLKWIAAGFVVGVMLWAMPYLSNGYDGIPWLIFACFLLPVISGILAAIRATRRFGLGLLLACGLGWLILLSICGGLWR